MGAGDAARFSEAIQAGEGDKFLDIIFVGAAGFRIGEVGQPFQFGRTARWPDCVGVKPLRLTVIRFLAMSAAHVQQPPSSTIPLPRAAFDKGAP
jgi:hypothetical protein